VKEKFKDTKGVIKSRKSMAEKIQWRNENREKDNSYSANNLKQQPAERHVAPLGHIILILRQPVFARSP
jgi:hypothetical protein